MVWSIGDFCVAKSSKFDDLYNARILDLLPNSSNATVSFIEYGDIEEVLIADLKPLGEFAINKEGDLVKGEKQRSPKFEWPGGWKVEDQCIAWWDGDKTWNNAKVIKIFSPEEVLVFFTDHGNADFTSLKDLKKFEGAGDAKDPKKIEGAGDAQDLKNLEVAVDAQDLKNLGTGDDKIEKASQHGKLAPKSSGDSAAPKTKISSWSVGDLCVAKWIEDDVWYRSKILEIDGDKVLVEFVEYGNQDYTAIGELKPNDALDGKEVVEKEKAQSWKIGDLCVAKSSKFDAFYNAQIMEINDKTALVEFIEYAKKEDICLEDLNPFGVSAVNKNGDLVKHEPNITYPSGWKDGDLCVSPWEVDNNLYNAKILKIFNTDEVLVQFVDHGNADFTSLASLKPAGSSLEKNDNLKEVKKDKEVPEKASKNGSKNSISSKASFHENKTASNKKNEEKVQAANLEKREAGKWTGESRRKPSASAIEKPRPLFNSAKNVGPKIVKVPSSHGQNASSAVKTPPKGKLSQTQVSPIISRKAKLGISESPPKSTARCDSFNKAAVTLSDISNLTLAALPDTSNMTAIQDIPTKSAAALPDASNMTATTPQNIPTISAAVLPDTSNMTATTLPDIPTKSAAGLPDTSNLAAVALTTSGSRYLQSIIPQMMKKELNELQVELMKNPLATMNHSTATFVVQKLMEVCDSAGLELYVSTVEQHFLSLSIHPAGCRVVQKCLALANPEQKERIALMMENYRTLVRLLRNKNGTYVAQALLPILPVRTTTFIVNSLLGHMVDIGRNPYGTYFIQQLVTGKAQGQVSVQLLVEEIITNVSYLVHDDFGTRLVQEVLASSSSPRVICGLGQWVATNMTAIFKSSPAVFLAKAVVQKLAGLGHGQVCLELLEDLVTSSLDTHVDSQPLLIAAALHPVGHGLAKEIVAQVNIVPCRSKLLAAIQEFALRLKQDTFGRLVLKALEGRI